MNIFSKLFKKKSVECNSIVSLANLVKDPDKDFFSKHKQDVKELEKNNIHRQYLKILEERGEVIRVIKGLYVAPDKDINEFFIMGERYKTGIFSHNTALYFYHLTDRTPMSLDMTFPSNVRVNNDFLEPHYIKPELHSLGETTLKLEDGTNIKIYDLERTICDIVKYYDRLDKEICNKALIDYFSGNYNEKNLFLYAKKMGIYEKLVKKVEVLR